MVGYALRQTANRWQSFCVIAIFTSRRHWPRVWFIERGTVSAFCPQWLATCKHNVCFDFFSLNLNWESQITLQVKMCSESHLEWTRPLILRAPREDNAPRWASTWNEWIRSESGAADRKVLGKYWESIGISNSVEQLKAHSSNPGHLDLPSRIVSTCASRSSPWAARSGSLQRC